MKVTLLMTPCSYELLDKSLEVVTKVLQELEVQLEKVELHKLPYYDGKKSKQMEQIMASVGSSDGIVALCAVPMLGMHGAMQSFFDSATLYDINYFNKPIFSVTCSKWLGEQEVCNMIQKCWNILGGIDGGSMAMNEALSHQSMMERLEKEVENFYRLIQQKRPNIGSSERLYYYQVKQGVVPVLETSSKKDEQRKMQVEHQPEIKSFAKMIKQNQLDVHVEPSVAESQGALDAMPTKEHHINLSTKEQTIKEIASLIEKEANGEAFTSIQTGVYGRPMGTHAGIVSPKKLQQIPHYFAAQYDKTLKMLLKYQLTDVNEQGYIIINDGDCIYQEKADETPTVEMILSEEVLQQILNKKMTYQKAFMLGKLKVKGNFAVLPKLDQAFKAL